MRLAALLTTFTLTIVLLGGCIEADDPGSTPDGSFSWAQLTVVDETTGEPVPFAQVIGLSDMDPVFIASTDPHGVVDVRPGPNVSEIQVNADGYAAKKITSLEPGVQSLLLQAATTGDGADESGWRFAPAVDLGTQTYPLAVGTACLEEDQPNDDCGLGEPSIEVDASGTIYLSGVCCIGAAPPVYVSRDDGESWQTLETPGIREAFGIEGDFAIDDDGVMYFIDIELAATFQVTAWDKDGEYLHHMKWPAPPLVDRPWIRAEGSGVLYYVYNTGTETNVYTSQDGGMTWSPTARVSLPYGLGNPVKGIEEGELWVTGGSQDGMRRVDFTTDAGETWNTETSTSPAGGSFPVGYFDEAGNLYLVSNAEGTITVARRDHDGTWQDAFDVTPEWGTHRMPWIAAGGEGKVAAAWYGTVDDEPSADSRWYLFVATSLDAHTDDPHWAVAIADPEPVLVGQLQRQLLDFLQVEIGPDDAVHVGYSKLRKTDDHEQLHYVRSERFLPLSAQQYFWGPKE